MVGVKNVFFSFSFPSHEFIKMPTPSKSFRVICLLELLHLANQELTHIQTAQTLCFLTVFLSIKYISWGSSFAFGVPKGFEPDKN
ncbi:MAG: hypothetical protein CM15mV115_240 [Caudoviricetes sp.]|nr:MAG: hypothetical protein CM15mV115_240 [Caudoviricetes sp.]